MGVGNLIKPSWLFLFISIVFLVSPVFAAEADYVVGPNGELVPASHDTTVTINPDVANCEELGNTFSANVKNESWSTDSIFEVRIYKGTAGIAEFECGAAPTG
jgi:hypothetical protein